MKPLQNYIEEEIKKFNNNFESLVPYKVGFLDRNTEISCSHDISDYKRNAKKVLRELFSQSLHRIAKITAEEIVPERRKYVSQPANYKGSDANVWREGYNYLHSDLQSKIKEFGI